MQKVYTAEEVFNGDKRLPDHAIIVEDGIVEKVLPIISLPRNTAITAHAHLIAPAFIDLQIYGANKRLLAAYPEKQSLQDLYEYCLSGGTRFVMPCVATNSYENIFKCIDAIRDYWAYGGKGVLGLHVEGPWINKKKKGAHIEEFIHSPTIELAERLLEYGKDVIRIITLAPEVCSTEVIKLVQSHGVLISAGHSDATYSQGLQGFNDGIDLATHLFNAMSSIQHRSPGLPGAIFQHDDVMASIIADGYHVNFEMISIAKKILQQRLYLITDAVTETNTGHYQHTLDGDKYTSNGILSGSAITMIRSVKNCITKAGIDLNEALRMASLYPAKAIGINNRIGMIHKGYEESFVFLDKNLDVIGTSG